MLQTLCCVVIWVVCLCKDSLSNNFIFALMFVCTFIIACMYSYVQFLPVLLHNTQVIAGLHMSFHVQYVCLCMRARWGLVVRASLDWPINYDGLLMMCNGMIY